MVKFLKEISIMIVFMDKEYFTQIKEKLFEGYGKIIC